MKVYGQEVNIMAKEVTRPIMEQSMMVNGVWVNIMARGHSNGQMEVFIRVIGKIVEKVEEVSLMV